MRPNTTLVINPKGGSGKTTIAINLAACFAAEGPPPTVQTLTQPSDFDLLDLICANQTLAPFNRPTPERSGLAQFVLQQLISDSPFHDFVLIDCPPNLYQCTWNALLAADYVVIPVPPEDFGTQGLRAVHQAIDHARQLNPKLQLLGHLVTRCDGRLVVHQAYEQRLRTLYGLTVFTTVVPEAVAFKLALAQRKPVTLACPGTKAAQAIEALAAEIAQRIADSSRLRRVA